MPDENKNNFLEVIDFCVIPGKGITAVIEGKKTLACNMKFLLESGVAVSDDAKNLSDSFTDIGASVIYISQENKLCGFVVLSDTLREKSKDMIDAIKKLSVTPVLVTGDNEKAAAFISEKSPNIKGFNRRGLYRMKQFYETYKNDEFVTPLVTQIN